MAGKGSRIGKTRSRGCQQQLSTAGFRLSLHGNKYPQPGDWSLKGRVLELGVWRVEPVSAQAHHTLTCSVYFGTEEEDRILWRLGLYCPQAEQLCQLRR